jgi:hypothetical protein
LTGIVVVVIVVVVAAVLAVAVAYNEFNSSIMQLIASVV